MDLNGIVEEMNERYEKAKKKFWDEFFEKHFGKIC